MADATLLSKAPAAPCSALTGVLQRKCACGTHAPGGGECEACRRETLQRRGCGGSAPAFAPPLVKRVRVTSPNAPRIRGTATASGKLQNMESWLLLGHELCGHAWLEEHGKPGEDEEGLDPKTDACHHRTVEREIALRAEHGLGPRGFHLKAPFCGESFFRDRAKPDGPAQFDQVYDEKNKKALKEMGRGDEAEGTYLDSCQRQRIEAFGDAAKKAPVEEAIP